MPKGPQGQKRNTTVLLLVPGLALLGFFCGHELAPATLVWVAPGLAALALIIVLVPYLQERRRNAQGS
jgi:hypothetical protein